MIIAVMVDGSITCATVVNDVDGKIRWIFAADVIIDNNTPWRTIG